MKIFLSYSSKDRPVATRVQLALTGSRHQVFFDKESLRAGTEFHGRIRAEIAAADLFIFLISENSLAPGSYALTELKFARQRWPHPRDHVLPVLISPTQTKDEYLNAVQMVRPEGDVAAEVAAAVEDLLATNSCLAVTAIAGRWHDVNNPGTESQITQDGTSFRFDRRGVLPNGMPFQSSGRGTITGQEITSSYEAAYGNGMASRGTCRGTVSPDGARISLTCTDSLLGTFVSSDVRA